MVEAEEPKFIREPSFGGKHSLSMRLWHWITVVIITGSLLTVLFAKVLFNTRGNIVLVKNTLQKSNVTVTDQQARSVSHEFNDLVWGWHVYLGYALAGLFLFRIVFEFFQPHEQKLIPGIKKALKYLKIPGKDQKETKHYLFVKATYILFYISLAVQTLTGLFMVYSDDEPNLENIRETVSHIHAVCMWVIIAYILLHIGGVVRSEILKKKGIVSDMIHGGE